MSTDILDATKPIRIVDLFAGPGGLSEGFATCHRYRSQAGCTLTESPFDVALSIEKDVHAVRTLRLRHMRLILAKQGRLEEYDEAVSAWSEGNDPDVALRTCDPDLWRTVRHRVRRITLGNTKSRRKRLLRFVDAAVADNPWILLGGPPCQAYSLAGRSRNKGLDDYVPEKDERQTLYEEYLNVLAHGEPDAFVFENVKGLLSASLPDRQIFDAMLRDLADPCQSFGVEANRHGRRPRYTLYSLVTGGEIRSVDAKRSDRLCEAAAEIATDPRPDACVVRMEQYGVPQARHRVIVLGLLDGRFKGLRPEMLRLQRTNREVTAADVLNPLPALRSGLSRGEDSREQWKHAIRRAVREPWYLELSANGGQQVASRILTTVAALRAPNADRGAAVLARACRGRWTGKPTNAWHDEWKEWFCREDFRVFGNHEARGHMESDLHRYLFAAAYAQVHGESPRLRDFPPDRYPQGLLPDHANVELAMKNSGYFGDRFRVQLAGQPSRTVTSHISKDGHYYIHYDPSQCRSLTVREAARLQTFPDDYIFLGPRTEQYRQVGNAVPPYLAAQIALILNALFTDHRNQPDG